MSGDDGTVGHAVEAVRSRISRAAERAGRAPTDVRFIAVTKGFGPSYVKAAVASGVFDIGENRVQEALAKRQEVSGVSWHLLGHLQSNKAKPAAEFFDAIHSVDSERIARALATHRPLDAEPMAALIEVELTGISTRSGVPESAAEELLRGSAGLPGIHVLGLMTIAPPVDDPQDARAYFIRFRELRDRLEQSSGWALPELSMGMSSDFEVAVEEGATMVRVGRAIFGARP
jgi:pyridoxal phosphate enzyme (YggS family)